MPHSLYFHIPFCTHRCAYCDFNTYAGQEDLIPMYVEALCRELECVAERAPGDFGTHTIFFGGGTPSLLDAEQVGKILHTTRSTLNLQDEVEVTLEANPGTVSRARLRELRSWGINRLSLGVQSSNSEELRMLERNHNYGDVLGAVSGARQAGLDNLNLDLIFGLPDQTMQSWQTTVRRILRLEPEHISAYALTIEHGTPFGQWTQRGLLQTPDPDLAADMYEWLGVALNREGYEQYEISNWARPGRQCLHNLQYWRGGPYLGIGAGAHGYAGGIRYSNLLGIRAYIERLGPESIRPKKPQLPLSLNSIQGGIMERPFPLSPAAVVHKDQAKAEEMADFMIMGLRLTQEGIGASSFQQRFGRQLQETYGTQLSQLVQQGLLEWAGGSHTNQRLAVGEPKDGDFSAIRLTERGRLLGNRVFAEFVVPPAPDQIAD